MRLLSAFLQWLLMACALTRGDFYIPYFNYAPFRLYIAWYPGHYVVGTSSPDCVTPSNGLGKCIEVRFCVSIMTALINNDHLTNPNVAKYLRESQCGLQRDSHRVCCNVNDIDFGDVAEAHTEATTVKLASELLPPHISTAQLSNFEKCGRLSHDESPTKWIGELWFKVNGRDDVEPKCIGALISKWHLVIPAHCVASLPDNVVLDFVEIQRHEFSVLKIFIHASYNQPKFANDIAIIELDKATGEEESNDAACLPKLHQSRSQHELRSLVAVVRTGGVLKCRKSEIVSANDCSSTMTSSTTQSTGQFCANVQENGTSSALTGVVMFESDENRRFAFTGLTGETNMANNKPLVFTDLAHHLNWIRAAIGDDLERRPGNPKISNDPALSNLPKCRLPKGTGFCVKYYQCSLVRDAPPNTADSEEIKCFTEAENNVHEDGVCCHGRHVELNYSEVSDFDLRFQNKRGIELLNMKTCGQVDPTRRIVGGTQADMKEFPWIGLIKYKYGRIFKFTCGSSLISDKYLLTCAHCITNLPSGYEIVGVRVGEYDRTTDPDCSDDGSDCNPAVDDIPVEKVIPHPKYNMPRYSNDIGLVRLTRAPDLSQGTIPICLPINRDMQTISDKYTVAGFGFTENGRDSDVLLKVVLPKVSKASCQSLHSSVIQLSEGHECYGGEGIRDSCKGDSGNPLMNYVNVKGRIKAVQLGVVVAGHSECGRGVSGFPGIYSDVNFYLEWVLDNLVE